MRKLALLALCVVTVSTTVAQKNKQKINRAADHFMVQLSYDSWLGMPDSINQAQSGFSRGANVYVMLDKPFKNNSRFSIGFGLGISTSNMVFKRMEVDITSNQPTLPFTSLSGQSYFKKYKLSTTHAEIPVELRFMKDPTQPKKTFKAAAGIKVGTLLKAQTKAKNLLDAQGNPIGSYTEKQSSKTYFNSTRIAATARIGYGIFSIHGAYTLNNLFKDGVAPEINTLQIGITFSGL
ncbi:MAG TPA: hypothetical protein DEU93_01125 [Chitinophagaceae bacterium]|nr:hypothetical protein [Chitinophagaceae bacterium]HML57484.1 outer membrane beta-barrel protein [Ferruginibacter sp.]